MPGKQFLTSRVDGPLHYLSIHLPDHTPHWKRYGGGRAQVDFTSHDKAGWLSIDAREFAEDGKSSKRTMLTLDEAGGRALYARLKAMYEPSAGGVSPEDSASSEDRVE